MRIEGLGVIILAVWIIYLLWRIGQLKKSIGEVSAMVNAYQTKKELMEKSLVNLLAYYDYELLSKLSEKTRKKITLEQSNELRCIFKNNYAEPMYLNGNLTPIESKPMDRLGNILGCEVSDDEDSIGVKRATDRTNAQIQFGLEDLIDSYK